MLSSLLFSVSFVGVALAVPYPGAPKGFNPYKKYPKKAGFVPHSTAHQGQHYNLAHSAAAKAAADFGPGSYVDNPQALAWYNPDFTAGTQGVDSYTCYSGYVNDLPSIDQWMNFYDMFTLNQQNGMAGSGDSGEQQGEIYNAIVTVSQESKVDARVILAVIMQESTGNVYAPCTAGYNCGLMQANHGSVSYDPGNSIADSQNSINQMVRDGTEGTTQGPGYVQYLNGGPDYDYTNCNLGDPYTAARAYNQGDCAVGGNLNCCQFGTISYVNDIANRLTGWSGNGEPQGQCDFPPQGCT